MTIHDVMMAAVMAAAIDGRDGGTVSMRVRGITKVLTRDKRRLATGLLHGGFA